MKWKWLWIAPIVLLLLVGTLAGLILATETGTRWLLYRVPALIPGELTVQEVNGTLLGPLALKGLHYRSTSAEVHLESLALDWVPASLLRGDLHITRLDIQSLDYIQRPTKPAPKEKRGLPDIQIPLRVSVEQAEARDVSITTPARTFAISELNLAGRADDQGLHLDRLRVEAPEFRVALEGSLLPQGDYPMDLTLEWSSALKGIPMMGEARVEGDLKRLAVVHTSSQPLRTRLHGTINLKGPSPEFDVKAEWEEARWPLEQATVIQSPQGNVILTGRTTDYAFTLDAVVKGQNVPAARWQLKGQGDLQAVTFERLHAAFEQGELSGTARVRWSPFLAWEAAIQGQDLNPAVQWPQWPGKLSIAINAEGALQDQALRVRVEAGKVEGELRGYPFSAETAFAFEQGALDLSRLELRSGSARLQASGALAERWDVTWRLAAPELRTMLPDASGALNGQGSVNGPRNAPEIKADLTGRDLAFQDHRLAKLDLAAHIDVSDAAASRLGLKATGIELANHIIAQAKIEAVGRMAAHTVEAAIDAPRGSLRLKLTGELKDKRWQGSLRNLAASVPQLGRWTLQRPVELRASADEAVLQEACWSHEDARLCAQGEWRKDTGWQARAALTDLPASLFKTWLPEPVTVTGSLDGEVTAGAKQGVLHGKAALRSGKGRLTYRPAQREQIVLNYQQVALQASLERDRLSATARLDLSSTGAASADIALSSFSAPKWRESRLKGTVKARFTELGLLTAFVPAVAESRGVIAADVTLAETLGDPQVTGEVTLEQGGADVVPLGIQIKNLRLVLSSTGGDAISVRGQVSSGPGTLDVTGDIRLNADQGWPASLRVQGKRFEAMDTPQARVLASPDLSIEMRAKRIEVTGEVAIPEATITVRELSKGAVRVSEDVVIVDAPAPKGEREKRKLAAPTTDVPGWEIYTRVTVILGDEVRFAGFGLSARLTGRVQVTDTPGQVTLGEGEVTIVEGKYEAYGQKLTISQGRLMFAGPVQNPVLDVRVTREVDDITAGLQVSGTPKAPQITVFSDPTMPQADALSYLLLGRPLNEASGQEGRLLMDAVSTLGVKGGEYLAKRIGQALGLQEVQVQTGETLEETSLVVGQYLSPRLYLSYGLGLFGEGNTVRMRYKLSDKLTLQVEGGTQQGADLLYNIEFE